MFKLVVLSALVAVAVAKPGHLHGAVGYSSYLAPAALSHSYRSDVVSKPVIAAYAAAPVVQQTYVSAPIAVPSAVSSSYRTDVVRKTVVAAPVVSYAAAPVVHQAVVPAAVSHSYRSDVVSAPIVQKTIVAAPVVSYAAAPAVSYGYAAAPVVQAW